jgi:hypothetical protein
LKVLPLQAGDPGLLDLPVHTFELIYCELLDMLFDDFDALMVVGEIGSMTFEAILRDDLLISS